MLAQILLEGNTEGWFALAVIVVIAVFALCYYLFNGEK